MRGFSQQVVEWFPRIEPAKRRAKRLSLLESLAEAMGEQDYAHAEDIARQLHSRDPSVSNTLAIASALIHSFKLEQAQEVLDTIAPRNRKSAGFLEAKLLLAAASNDEASVLALFEALANDHPKHDSADIGCEASGMLSKLGFFDQSQRVIEAVQRRHPKDLRVQAQLAKCTFLRGDHQTALELLRCDEEQLETAPPSHLRNRRSVYAELLIELGWLEEAFDFLIDEVQTDPAHWILYYLASDCAIAGHREREYERLINEQLAHRTDNQNALSLLCYWHAQQRELSPAEELLLALQKIAPRKAIGVKFHIALQSHDREKISSRYEDCAAQNLPLLGIGLSYAIHLYYYGMQDGGLERALDLINGILKVAADSFVAQQLRLRLLLALKRDEEAERIYHSLPEGMKQSHRLHPFQFYFDQLEGNDQSARAGWSKFLVESRHNCINARSSYPKTVDLKYQKRDGDVLLFFVVFNGMDYIDWFLRYYRDLGVAHFFVTDNASTDGTFERLLSEPDVSVFQNKGSFSSSAFGLLWTNHLMARFGVGHWCLHVDIDEGFVFPGQQNGRTLHDLISYLDSKNFECIRSFMLDMYPADLTTEHVSDPFEACCYFDVDYGSMQSEFPPYEFTFGGLRQRLTQHALMMNKSPLVRMGPDVRYLINNHYHTHLRVADITSALLHYKFVGGIEERLREAIGRGEHFMRAQFYKTLEESLNRTDPEQPLLTEHSRKFNDASDLMNENLIKSSAAWDAFVPDKPL